MSLYLNEKDLKFLSDLLGKPKNHRFLTKNNVVISYELSSRTKIKSVICSTPVFDKLNLGSKLGENIKYCEQKAYRIKNDVKGLWDLILIDEKGSNLKPIFYHNLMQIDSAVALTWFSLG